MKILKVNTNFARKNPRLLGDIYNTVFNVSQYLPLSCKCVEISAAVKYIAFIYRLNAKVVIGVKSPPFVAHAWIESGKYSYGNENVPYKVIGEF